MVDVPNPSDLRAQVRYYLETYARAQLRYAARKVVNGVTYAVSETIDVALDYTLPGREQLCDMSTSLFQMTVEEMLAEHEEHIKTQGVLYNIDGRAIAGAIAWEYEQNALRGRLSDYAQYWPNPFVESGATVLFGQGLGWGSIHVDSIKPLIPEVSEAELACMRLQASSAITLVAIFMDAMATRSFEGSEGIWVRDQPAILALFFRVGDDNGVVSRWAAQRRQDECKVDPEPVALDISQDEMAAWVDEHLDRFAPFHSQPVPPQGYYVPATIKSGPTAPPG